MVAVSPGAEELVLVQSWVPISAVPKLDELAQGEDRSRSAYLRKVIMAHIEEKTASTTSKETSR